jgi:PAS domain S-box-containing protein
MVSRPRPNKIYWSLVLVFFLFSMGLGTAGYFFYKDQKKSMKERRWDDLRTIAHLKAKQIENWRKERIAEGTIILENPFIGQAIRRWLDSPRETEGRQRILGWMACRQKYLQYEQYKSIHLLDTKGVVRLSFPDRAEVLDLDTKALVGEAMQKKKVILSDLYRSKSTDVTHLDLLAPILIPEGHDTSPVGILLLRIDPNQFLYPLIQSWPARSRTSESLLVRREGEEVLFLNELRHRKDTALSLRFPISKEELPAAMAARGQEGIVEGIDYRGVRVLAAMQQIPGSTWFFIAKVDQEEINAPIRQRAWLVGFLVGGLILGTALSVSLLWHRESLHFQRKQYESELERLALEKRFDYLTKYANDIILLVDQDFKIIEANERAVESYGYQHDELLQLSLKDLHASEVRSNLDEQIKQVEWQNGLVFETLHQRKGGTIFPVESSSRLIEVEGKRFYQSIIRDITERRQVEEELRMHREHLEELVEERTERIKELEHQRTEIEKVVASGLVAARIAHEINNPLAGIKNSFLLVKDAIPEDHPYYEYVGRIEKEINRTARIIRQMFDLYRPDQETINEFTIDKTIYDIVALLEVASQDRNVIMEVDSRPIMLSMSEGSIRQVLYNIFLNAIEASPQGGTVKIATKVDDGILELKISDQGIGIPEEEGLHIFEPFFTTKRGLQRGLGLGLSVSKEIIEAMGGNIAFESEAGKGTIFRITLPLNGVPMEMSHDRFRSDLDC